MIRPGPIAAVVLIAVAPAWGQDDDAPPDDPADTPQPHVSADRLMETVRSLPEKRAAVGTAEHWEGLAKAETLIQEKLEELGLEPVLHEIQWHIPMQLRPKAPEGKKSPEPPAFHNIVVDLIGVELPEEILIVGAHLDAVAASPGADDNGSGTAALLELARVLKGRPMKRTVRLIFFNIEEHMLTGSRDYALRVLTHERPRPTVIGMISLESIGYFSDEPGSQKSPIDPIEGVFEPPTVGNFISIVGIKKHQHFSQRLKQQMEAAAPGLKVEAVDFMPIPMPDMLRSDHAPFLLRGDPAVMLTDTASFRNPNYHKATDTPDTLDPQRLSHVVKGVAEAVYRIAEPADAAQERCP